jgi:hypothetical protein
MQLFAVTYKQSIKVMWDNQVARMEKNRDKPRVLVGKYEGKNALRISRQRSEKVLKWNLKK